MALFENKFHAAQWHEGMLLGAQHFQHTDFYHHTFIHHHLQTLGAYHWGLYHITIDQAQLVAGVYRILTCQAFMPDGAIVHYDAEDDYDLILSFKDQGEILSQKPLKIYLAIPKYRKNSVYQTSETPRYRSTLASNVIDLNTGDNPIDFPVLIPQCLLLREDQITHQYVSFPIAEIGIHNDAYSLTAFSPPYVKVLLESPLGHTCLDILAYLKDKALLLNDRLQSTSLPDVMVATLTEQFRALMPSLPPFEALLYSHHAHPFQLYIALTHLIGNLMTLKPEQVIADVPPYDHHQLNLVFQEIFILIKKYTDDLGHRFKRLIFQEDAQGFILPLSADLIGSKMILAVRPGSSMTEQDATRWMKSAIIASGHAVSDAKDRRVLGASRTLMVTVDQIKMIPPLGTILYQVDVDPFFIQPQSDLHIFNPSESQKPSEVMLMIRDETP